MPSNPAPAPTATPMYMCGPTCGCGKTFAMVPADGVLPAAWTLPERCPHCGREQPRNEYISRATGASLMVASVAQEDATCPCGAPLIRNGVIIKSHWTGKVCEDCEAAMFARHGAALASAEPERGATEAIEPPSVAARAYDALATAFRAAVGKDARDKMLADALSDDALLHALYMRGKAQGDKEGRAYYALAVAQQKTEIQRLRAALNEAERETATLTERLAKASEALEKYGGHMHWCEHYDADGAQCTCGYDAARRAAAGGGE